ncbi:unnamed protein product [Triticum turgidum subsp. durum]|uniref:Secreted protein n=1 Tax=Triticum turgidum subsp. durum TaxID=4567 RepID=A0A9R0R119_TRITD|nr:unnamed protein product [Triticum turgidum subsp. durum]
MIFFLLMANALFQRTKSVPCRLTLSGNCFTPFDSVLGMSLLFFPKSCNFLPYLFTAYYRANSFVFLFFRVSCLCVCFCGAAYTCDYRMIVYIC